MSHPLWIVWDPEAGEAPEQQEPIPAPSPQDAACTYGESWEPPYPLAFPNANLTLTVCVQAADLTGPVTHFTTRAYPPFEAKPVTGNETQEPSNLGFC